MSKYRIRKKLLVLGSGILAAVVLAPDQRPAEATILWPCEGVPCGVGEPDCEMPCTIWDRRNPLNKVCA